jgi:hypothetical protein
MLQHRTLPNQRAREKVLASFPPERVRALCVSAPGDIWEIGAANAQSVYNINRRPSAIIKGRHNLLKSQCEGKNELLELSLCA